MLFWLTSVCLWAGWQILCQFCFSWKIHFSQHRFASVWGMRTLGSSGLKVVGSFLFGWFLVSLKLRAESFHLFSVLELPVILMVSPISQFCNRKICCKNGWGKGRLAMQLKHAFSFFVCLDHFSSGGVWVSLGASGDCDGWWVLWETPVGRAGEWTAHSLNCCVRKRFCFSQSYLDAT